MKNNGYAVVKNLLSSEEIHDLRITCADHLSRSGTETNLGKLEGNCAVRIPQLGWVFTHPKILDTVRSALGSKSIVFTGNSDIQISRLSGWHKDDGDGQYLGPECYDAPDCRIFRVGIYLQDHTGNDQGLRVKRGSHVSPSNDIGDVVYLPTAPGDIVIFDVRLTHAGQLPDLIEKAIWEISDRLGNPVMGRLCRQAYWSLIGRTDKLSLYTAFGLPNRYTEAFAHATMGSHLVDTGNRRRLSWPDNLVSALQGNGIGHPDFT